MMPEGTYVISMAQGDKHFIQTFLNEGSYTPFEYFYDLTGWSATILQNVAGGYCASELAEDMQATTLTAKDAAKDARKVAEAQAVPEKLRKLRAQSKADKAQNAGIVVLRAMAGNNPGESFDWLVHKMNQDWQLPYTEMLSAEFAAGIPPTVSVLVVPSVNAATVFAALGEAGREAITTWVASGGHIVTWQGSAQLASDLGLSMTVFDPPSSSSPGNFFRLMMDVAHPLADGVGPETFMYYRSTLPVMRSFQHRIVGFFPDDNSDDFYVNGFHEGADVALSGSTGVHQRVVESGLVTSFAYEINFRGFTSGTSKMVMNAIAQNVAETVRLSDEAGQQPSEFMRTHNATLSVRPQLASVGRTNLTVDWSRNVMITVTAGASSADGNSAAFALKLATAVRHAAAGGIEPATPPVFVSEILIGGVGKSQTTMLTFAMPNEGMLTVEEHSWWRNLPAALKNAGLAKARTYF